MSVYIQKRGRFSAIIIAAIATAGSLSTAPAQAQIGEDVADPPVLKARNVQKSAGFLSSPAARAEQLLDLNIEYVDGTIFNPATGRHDKVRLRSYTQPGAPPPTRYISPAIHTRPGQTLRVNLHNKLPPTTTSYDVGCTGGNPDEPNKPHCFNGTNLHTHGLWVNPSGNGDNVLLSINPGVSFEYEYAIPPEHPAGTFWYHTHRHGSTALQVSSGMAGALIIHGDRVPTPDGNGDLDTLLAGVPELKDRTLVFQQIQYGCFDDKQNIKFKTGSGKDGKPTVVEWVCGPDDRGGIETYDDKTPAPFGPIGFGPGSWGQSARYTSINGQVLPRFRAEQGRMERWRMIHGGVRDTIALTFLKAKRKAELKAGRKLLSSRMDALIGETCEGAPLPFHVVAADGLTLAQAQEHKVAVFQPGYRFDALVRFPEAGDYCVIDTASQALSSVGGAPSGSRLLGMVRVAPGTSHVARPDVAAQLLAAAATTMPQGEIRDSVVAGLQDKLKLTRFVPHRTIEQAELKGGQRLTFNIDVKANPIRFEIANQLPKTFGFDPQPYDPSRLDRKLTLGTAEQWRLTSAFVSHPFHIHVNPFQIVSIKDPKGREVSLPGADDGGDPQYPGLAGVWKDTLWVKEGYTLTVNTRYERYIGEFVLHCHILDHEDQGMMQNVAIVLPGGTPASVNAPHSGRAGHRH